jgi:hypothetical protein
MHFFIAACIACCGADPGYASEPQNRVGPRLARTTDEIIKAAENSKGFGSLQTAEFHRHGQQIFAVWYCPFSGRAACYLHAYFYDHEKARWIRFIDRLVEGTHDLSPEMPTREEVIIFRGADDKVVLKESVAKYPRKE